MFDCQLCISGTVLRAWVTVRANARALQLGTVDYSNSSMPGVALMYRIHTGVARRHHLAQADVLATMVPYLRQGEDVQSSLAESVVNGGCLVRQGVHV